VCCIGGYGRFDGMRVLLLGGQTSPSEVRHEWSVVSWVSPSEVPGWWSVPPSEVALAVVVVVVSPWHARVYARCQA
jgi:hypothetical protein